MAASTTLEVEGEEGWVRVGRRSEVERAMAMSAEVDGREVVLFATHDGGIVCLDRRCYHHGGDLLPGKLVDVEDFGLSVVCPWHKYKIALQTGEGMYTALDGTTKSKGKLQRTHDVRISPSDDVYVRLDLSGRIESDVYGDPKPEPDENGVVVLPNGTRVIYT